MANALANLFTDIADSIRSKTGSTEKLSPSEFASQIDSISVGGGGAEGCVTVTFMNGDDVLLTRPVYIGDDCPDPVTQGRIETPTKESTVQYNYTYKGWSEALTNITEDKVIYATFTESVRTYTVTFYDEDGTTVLNTEQVAYGGSSTYAYKKDNYLFIGWTPEPTNITGNLECVGAWQESYSFADATWEYIAQLSESGQASQVFSVGDTRTETIDGNDYTLEIIGLDHDDLADGSGKAGVTVWIKDYMKTTVYANRLYSAKNWESGLKSWEAPIFDLLSSELQNIIKPVNKQFNEAPSSYNKLTGSAKIWSLSAAEINLEPGKSNIIEGTTYAKFVDYPNKLCDGATKYPDIKLGVGYWLRSYHWSGAPIYVGSQGNIYYTNLSSTYCYVCPCFCI